MNVNAKDIKTDRLDVVGGVRREKKLVGIGDKEREGWMDGGRDTEGF